MPWTVLFDAEFAKEFASFPAAAQRALANVIAALRIEGPRLGRPWADTLKGSDVTNLKELRARVARTEWRVLFAFDHERQAILLTGGAKTGRGRGSGRWYEEQIAIAERRAKRHNF